MEFPFDFHNIAVKVPSQSKKQNYKEKKLKDMKVFDYLLVVALSTFAGGSWSCSSDDGGATEITINITASDCELEEVNPVCPDSNLFVVTFSALVSGPEGTFIGLFASGDAPETTLVDCGNWTNKNFPGLPGCSREPGDSENANISVEGELPCLGISEVYGSQNFFVAGFDPGATNLSPPFASTSADIFVNCVF